LREKLLKKSGNTLIVLKPEERCEFIEDKMKKGEKLTLIDRIHFLYSLHKNRKPIGKYVKEWGDESIRKACELIYRKTGDDVYAKVGGIIGITPKKRTTTTLYDFLGGS
jgi:hypothetical protein